MKISKIFFSFIIFPWHQLPYLESHLGRSSCRVTNKFRFRLFHCFIEQTNDSRSIYTNRNTRHNGRFLLNERVSIPQKFVRYARVYDFLFIVRDAITTTTIDRYKEVLFLYRSYDICQIESSSIDKGGKKDLFSNLTKWNHLLNKPKKESTSRRTNRFFFFHRRCMHVISIIGNRRTCSSNERTKEREKDLFVVVVVIDMVRI